MQGMRSIKGHLRDKRLTLIRFSFQLWRIFSLWVWKLIQYHPPPPPSSALYATSCQETHIQLKFGWGQFSSSFGILRGIFGPNQDRTQGGSRMTGLESADQNHIGALECDERAPLEDLKPTIDWSYMSTQWKTLFWAEIWTIRPLSGFVLSQIWSAQPIFWYKGRSPEKK